MIKKIALAFALTVLFIPSTYAAGLKVNILSTSALGNANAGRGVLSEDASVVYYNPAGMTDFKDAVFSGGLFGAQVKGQLRDFNVENKAGQKLELGDNYDDGGDFVPDAVFPFLYYIQPITDDFYAGIGFFPAFSTHTRYSKKAIVGEFAGATQLRVLDLQPTFAYKINDMISVGAGLDFYFASGELSKMAQPDPKKGFAAEVIVKGKDSTMAWHAAVKLKPIKGTSIGLTYHSETSIDLKGSGDFIQIKDDGTRIRTGKEKGNVPLALPQSIDISVAQEVTKNLTLLGSVTWMEWSVFEKLDIIGTKGGSISGLQRDLNQNGKYNYLAHVNTNWRDTYTVNIGGNYQLNKEWMLRFGYMYDQNAGQDDTIGITRVPSSNQKWWTTGFNFKVSKSLSLDAGMSYVEPVKVRINDSDVGLDNKPLASSPRAQAKSEVNAMTFSTQINYKF